MQADYSVELGADDPVLEIPWFSDEGALCYYDLKARPELVNNIPEAKNNPDLAAFLARINASSFPLQTAKCDVWSSHEISPEEEIFGAMCKFASYIDVFFAADNSTSNMPRTSFPQNESLAKKLCKLLQQAPEIAATIELVIRRCFYNQTNTRDQPSTIAFKIDANNPQASLIDNPMNGFYITAYVYGFGDTEDDASKHWSIALKLLQHALVQASQV
jgi:hypothetical protein